MNKVRAASEFDVQFQIPGTPDYCQAYFKRKLTVARFVEGQKVWFQTGSVFGGNVRALLSESARGEAAEPTPGLEPGTPSLRVKCSTN